jgi:3-phenylpropionate/trans-cinnamate dioxygenase ferredoxin subunit|tara:strand:- start:5 stop:400 length:396 start_codon:yes stop_codon:yes gene_type:complete
MNEHCEDESALMDAPFVSVGDENMLRPNEVAEIEIEGDSILLCNSEGRYYAIQNLCTHDNAPLGLGRLIGWEIECSRHGAKFNVTNGDESSDWMLQSLVTFPLRIRDGKIEVQYTKPEPPAFRLIGDRNQG